MQINAEHIATLRQLKQELATQKRQNEVLSHMVGKESSFRLRAEQKTHCLASQLIEKQIIIDELQTEISVLKANLEEVKNARDSAIITIR